MATKTVTTRIGNLVLETVVQVPEGEKPAKKAPKRKAAKQPDDSSLEVLISETPMESNDGSKGECSLG